MTPIFRHNPKFSRLCRAKEDESLLDIIVWPSIKAKTQTEESNQMFTTNEIDPRTGQPLLVDVKVVARMLGRCERSIWRYDAAGKIPRPIDLMGAKKWRLKELRRWVGAGCPDRETWESRKSSPPTDITQFKKANQD
jgi:predicted DNA-binding transcriptional regulator AlpA